MVRIAAGSDDCSFALNFRKTQTPRSRKADDASIPISPFELVLYQKRLQGSLFGASNPSRDIPKMLDLYQAGRLRLDELVTRTYRLDDIIQGYDDMYAGKNIRGVVIHEH